MGRGIEEAKNQNCISQLEQNFCATPTPTGCWRGVLLEFRISFTLCIYLENQQQRLKRITCKTFPCITTTGVRSFVSSTATGPPFFLSLYYITFRLPVTSFFFFYTLLEVILVLLWKSLTYSDGGTFETFLTMNNRNFLQTSAA